MKCHFLSIVSIIIEIGIGSVKKVEKNCKCRKVVVAECTPNMVRNVVSPNGHSSKMGFLKRLYEFSVKSDLT